jgi:hypothetical protein
MAARILTPLVQSALQRFVKSSEEGVAGALKASVSGGGGVTLHNLELNLDSLLGGAAPGLRVKRAFAKQLSIAIPWRALTTQPISVVLDAVEIQLCPDDGGTGAAADDGDESGASESDDDDAAAGGGGASWLGSALQSLALRAGLNLAVTLCNVVVKYAAGAAVATLAFREVALANSADGAWREAAANPEAWLAKECVASGVTLGLDAAGDAGAFAPLLRASHLRVAALLPIFHYMQGAPLEGDALRVSVIIEAAPLEAAVNDRQLAWARSLLDGLAAAAAAASAKPAAAPRRSGDGSAAAPEAPAAPEARPPPAAAAAADAQPPPPPTPPRRRQQMRALGVFGRVWDYVVDEATYLEAEAEAAGGGEGSDSSGGDGAAPERAPMHAELEIVLAGVAAELGAVRSECGAGALDEAPGELQQAELSATLRQLQNITSLADAAVVQRELSVALEAQGLTPTLVARRRRAFVAPLLALEVGEVTLATASTDNTMQSIKLRLDAASVRRYVSAAAGAEDALAACWDEVLGLHSLPSESPRQSPASPRAEAAVQARWFNVGQGGGSGAASSQRCALELGQVFMAYAPGLATDLALWAGNFAPPALAPSEPVPTSKEGTAAVAAPPGWLRSGMLVDLSAGALQMAFLSSQRAGASALVLTVLRVSGRSGALNWSASWVSSAASLVGQSKQKTP